MKGATYGGYPLIVCTTITSACHVFGHVDVTFDVCQIRPGGNPGSC